MFKILTGSFWWLLQSLWAAAPGGDEDADTDEDALAKKIHGIDQRSQKVKFEHSSLRHSISLEQRGVKSEGFVGGTSSVVWLAAKCFAQHLCENPEMVKGRRVAELGAGIGLVGAVAAALGAEVVLTERDEGMPLLKHNIQSLVERGLAVSAKRLRWGSSDDALELNKPDGAAAFDVVLASDVMVAGFDTLLLLQSVVSLLKRSNDAVFILAFEFRHDWETIHLFCEAADKHGLESTSKEIDEDKEIMLYTFRWMPSSRNDLLAQTFNVSIPTSTSISLFLGSGVIFAMIRFRYGASIPSQKPLLITYT